MKWQLNNYNILILVFYVRFKCRRCFLSLSNCCRPMMALGEPQLEGKGNVMVFYLPEVLWWNLLIGNEWETNKFQSSANDAEEWPRRRQWNLRGHDKDNHDHGAEQPRGADMDPDRRRRQRPGKWWDAAESHVGRNRGRCGALKPSRLAHNETHNLNNNKGQSLFKFLESCLPQWQVLWFLSPSRSLRKLHSHPWLCVSVDRMVVQGSGGHCNPIGASARGTRKNVEEWQLNAKEVVRILLWPSAGLSAKSIKTRPTVKAKKNGTEWKTVRVINHPKNLNLGPTFSISRLRGMCFDGRQETLIWSGRSFHDLFREYLDWQAKVETEEWVAEENI